MADPPPSPDTGDDTGVGPDRGSTAGPPRWVKVFGIIAIVVALLVVIMLLVGGGHGPGRHTPSGGLGGETNQLAWRFSATATLEHVCHEPGHYPAGMRGQITVA
jgi:hypothetical protein